MTKLGLQRENEELRRQLAAAENALRALREGQVGAKIVEGAGAAKGGALEGAETAFRLAMETMAESALNVTPEGRILYCNARFGESVGLPLEQVRGRDLADFVAAEDQGRFRAMLKRCMAEPIRERLVLRNSKGTGQPVHLTGRALPQENRVSLWLLGSDLTELEASARQVEGLRDHTRGLDAAQAELAAAHNQIQSIIDNTPALVYAIDLEERFVLANSALAQVLDSTPAQIMGKRRHELMPQKDADWHEANDRQVIAAGKALEFEEHSELQGRSITWLTTKFPLRDGQGKIYAVAGISADISERKQVEAALRESEARRHAAEAAAAERQRFLDVLDTLPVILDIIRPDGRIEWANRAYRESLGDNTGKLCFQSQFGRDTFCTECQAFTPLKTCRPHHWEWTLPNGRTFDIFNYPFLGADGTPAILEMDIDITDRRHAEDDMKRWTEALEAQIGAYRRLESEVARLVEAERLKVGMELHDNLCQQLAAISMRVATINRKLRAEQSPAVEALGQLQGELRHAAEDAHRLSRGLVPVDIKAEGLAAALEELAFQTRHSHRVTCEFHCPQPVHVRNNTVATHFYRIAQEAVRNALKHAKAKRIVISLHDCDGLLLSIEDDGIGLRHAKTQREGAGLRLMDYRARMVGGSLEISPAAEGGTLIRCVLPPSPQPNTGNDVSGAAK
jgi:PAS domain S-box-containing protein